MVVSASSAAAGDAPVLDRFHYVVGTQTIGAAYQFTKEPRLVETARAILAMGSNTLKLALDHHAPTDPRPASLTDIVQREPALRTVLAMPFAHYLMWVSPVSAPPGPSFAANRLDAERREVYDLTRYLLATYSGTGKTFYLGNWEGDWLLTHTNPEYTPSADEVQRMIDWAKTRQQAVDDARRDTPHTDVQVYYYVEVNRVRDAMEGKVRVTNRVLPEANPDFVSYSSYDAQRGNVERSYAECLDYIQAQLRAKPDLDGPRVFIGEYGIPLRGHGARQQAQLIRQVMRAGLRWGCRFVLFWEMYNNEVTRDGQQRGFWLIDDQGVRQPSYWVHQRFLERAKAYVADFRARQGRDPSRTEFGQAALAWLPADPVAEPSGPLSQGSPFVDDLADLSHLWSRADGLVLDNTNPRFFEGRESRLKRSTGDVPRQVVYHGKGIQRFAVVGYMLGAFDGKLRASVSADARTWRDVPLRAETRPTADGWSRVDLTPATDLAAPVEYLRLELRGDASVYSPQLGQVKLWTTSPPAEATALVLPSVLSSGLVLQQQRPIRLWGRDLAGRTVRASLQRVVDGELLATGQAVTGADGQWQVTLPALPGSCDELRVILDDGVTRRVIEDVLLGDVWVCGGQSNMHLPVQFIIGGDALLAGATNPFLRFFCQDHLPNRALTGGRWSSRPVDDVSGGVWVSGDSAEALRAHEVSGIGYSFARALFARWVEQGRQVPIAIVNTATGATSIQSWLSEEAIRGDAVLATRYPATWVADDQPQSYNQATVEYNYKVAPLTRLGARGFLWSQGENDVGGPEAWAYYRRALEVLIKDWRARFGADDAPFIAAQLHPHLYFGQPDCAAGMREAQIAACAAAGHAVALPIHDLPLTWDVGAFGYKSPLHPLDKRPVGERMARAARALAYGEELASSGPRLARASADGAGHLVVWFADVAGHLMTPRNEPARGFAVCGADRVFHPARARLAGDMVVLDAAEVPEPVAATYAFTSLNQSANLTDLSGLPANPFRSDGVPSTYWHPAAP